MLGTVGRKYSIRPEATVTSLTDKEAAYIDELTELIYLLRRQYNRSLDAEWIFTSEFGAIKMIPTSREWLERTE